VTIKKVFFDVNIFNDIFDATRATHQVSNEAYLGALRKAMVLYTSTILQQNTHQEQMP